MELSFQEVKELIKLGQDIGLQQLQTQGLVVVYGKRAIVPSAPFAVVDGPKEDSSDEILKHYASLGKQATGR